MIVFDLCDFTISIFLLSFCCTRLAIIKIEYRLLFPSIVSIFTHTISSLFVSARSVKLPFLLFLFFSFFLLTLNTFSAFTVTPTNLQAGMRVKKKNITSTTTYSRDSVFEKSKLEKKTKMIRKIKRRIIVVPEDILDRHPSLFYIHIGFYFTVVTINFL